MVADLAKVPMRKIYGSDSVPEKVIKILSITSQLSEVAFFLENEATPIFRAEKGDLGGVEAGYE